MSTSGNPEKINTAQARALSALLTSRDIKSAADKAQVSERQLHRWLKEDANFQAALKEAETEAVEGAVRRLTGLVNASLDVLAVVMADKATTASVRIRAAAWLLEFAVKWREAYTLEQRITALEATNATT